MLSCRADRRTQDLEGIDIKESSTLEVHTSVSEIERVPCILVEKSVLADYRMGGTDWYFISGQSNLKHKHKETNLHSGYDTRNAYNYPTGCNEGSSIYAFAFLANCAQSIVI